MFHNHTRTAWSSTIVLMLGLLLGAGSARGSDFWLVDDDALGDPGPNDPAISDPLEDGSFQHPFDAIQEAVAAAADGDLIVALDGAYSSSGEYQIDFGGKALKLYSVNGPDSSRIDGRLLLQNGEPPITEVNGFLFRGYDNGLIIDGADPTIRNCVFEQCVNQSDGGAVVCTGGRPLFVQCAFARNSTHGDGGAVYALNSDVDFVNCLFFNNATSGSGTSYGSAVRADNGRLTFANCVVALNEGADYGAIALVQAVADFTNCTFYENQNAYNTAVYMDDLNSALPYDIALRFVNTIIWSGSDSRSQVYVYSDLDTVVSHCATRNGPSDFVTGDVGYPKLRWGDGNQLLEPDFILPQGLDGSIYEWRDNDWRLKTAALMDIGDSTALPPDIADLDHDGDTNELLSRDMAGNERAADAQGVDPGPGYAAPAVDLGAFEAPADRPYLCLSESELQLSIPEGEQDVVTHKLKLRNVGDDYIIWMMASWGSWMTVQSQTGMIEQGEVEVTISIAAAALEHGEHHAALSIAAPEADDPFVIIPVTVAISRIHRVPDQYATIRDALLAAREPWDIVELADGVYTGPDNRDLRISNRNIIIRSANGPEHCIIDCEDADRAFVFGNQQESRLEGITIRNALGRAIWCRNGAAPAIADCVITGTKSITSDISSAILCDRYSSPTLSRCVIRDNNAVGVYMKGSHCTRISDCEICRNLAGVYNTAYDEYNDTLIIHGARISDNVFGGVLLYNLAGFWMSNSALVDHRGDDVEYGIWLHSIASIRISGCTVANNAMSGIEAQGNKVEISDCLITGNDHYGVVVYGDENRITNCTFAANRPYTSDSSVIAGGQNAPTYISNCIVWGNEMQSLLQSGETTYIIQHSDIEDVWMNLAPLFLDPDGPDNDPATWEDNDYRLAFESPCVDHGDNTLVNLDALDLDADGNVVERTPFDLAGNPRFVDVGVTPDLGVADPPYYMQIVDMGALETRFCHADLNGDGRVNLSDLAELLGNFGTTSGAGYYDGDLDLDGDVDLSDLAEMLSNY